MRTALSEYAHALGDRAGRVSDAVLARAGGAPSRAEELERLLALRERGALSEAEFEQAKREVLAGR